MDNPLSDLEKALARECQKTEAIINSFSWRITAPLRAVTQPLKNNAPPAADIFSHTELDIHKALLREQRKVQDLTASLSWRLTGPLRKIWGKISGQPEMSYSHFVNAQPTPKLPSASLKAGEKPATYSYSVVSACYNAEQYLNDYFTSLVNQSISFTEHIRLIMVDDGSTDGTAAIIQHWQTLYPANITYLYQKNAGPGAARNRGLELVTTPWVTFLDPDDFVDDGYFETIDVFLTQKHRPDDPARQVQLIACNLIFYRENERVFMDNHPLRARFSKPETVLPYNQLGNLIHLYTAASIFSVAELRRQKLFYTEDRWPTFEDADLILRYFAALDNGLVAMLANAHYYYRKRGAQNSLVDLSRTDKKSYINLIQDGYLKNLSRSAEANNGVAKNNVQSTILYDLSWKIKALLNRPKPPFLSPEEARKSFDLIKQCFSYINRRLIEAYPVEISGFWFFYKAGTLACFKNMDPTFQIVYVKEYDQARQTVLLEYYCRTTGTMQISVDGDRALEPFDVKNTPQTILGETFCYLVSVMVQIPEDSNYLNVDIGELPTRISLNAKQHRDEIKISLIEKAFASPYNDASEEYEGAWLLMDRDTNADDNAEHLYRYIHNHHPEQKIFFALRASSPDWPRLEKEGFNMVDYDSDTFAAILKDRGTTVVSSHIDGYLTNYLPNMTRYKRFVFLQHGISSDNVSQWLNSKKIDLFITGAEREYEAIVAEDSPYKYSKRKVKLTGFARHDALVPHIGESGKIVAVMPTWRQYLVRSNVSNSAAHMPIDNFADSKYAHAWGGFLKSDRLKALSDRYGFRIVFYPHLNMQIYINDFNLPDYIQLPSSAPGSIQEVFKRAAIMVSDYSSCVFEMAFLKKSVLHYQFDRNDVLFGNAHNYTQGYFDYCRDGFGPVTETGDALLDELEKIMARGGEPEPVYLKRMEETFPWRDGNNCERIYQEIVKLERP